MVPEYKFAIREDLLDDKRFIPTKGEPSATGWDVRAAMQDHADLTLKPGDYFKIPLGFRAFPEEGWWFLLHPRSSSFAKKHLHNLIGIIDEHYNQEVLFAGQYLPEVPECLVIKFGEPIGQIVPVKRVEMGVLEISNQEYDDLCKRRMAVRTGGFGSTG